METKSKVRFSGFAILVYLISTFIIGVLTVPGDIIGIYIFFVIIGISLLNAYWGLNIIQLRREIRAKRKGRSLPEALKNLDK